ncbi:hypothetical protein [Acutalibacter caecimuris]|uniref:hypothetical protein n=1 Tax=Acutalibacter caecimuris TaxID=3093657 RepID=UPI002AC8FEF3|nr:hypothetical protein [Acutalibacter sp. M00118]
MTQEQLYAEYITWLGGSAPLAQDELFRLALADQDILEDDSSVVNRLYFAIPHFEGPSLRLFVFFEENHFLKDASGELSLSHSAFFLP